MRIRIFIAIHYLEIGGAERSLIGLLNALDYSKYEVDLFVYNHRGEFMNLIPKQVNILPEIGSYAAIEKPIVDTLKEGHVGVAMARLLAKLKYKIYKRKYHPKEGSEVFQYVADCVTPILPSLISYGLYDIAISFLTPHNVVRDKVMAKKKLAWIHTDYSTIDINVKKELPVWASYDRIFAVSEGVKETFVKVFPSLSNKVDTFENILSESFIREQAKIDIEHIELEFKDKSIEYNTPHSITPTFNLLSVGRFAYAKNFDNVPFICRKIIDNGLKIKWYLIGYGGDEALIREKIAEAGVEDICIILGKKENPYPYMSASDVYIQPSRFEGKAVTVREAQILCKPVIIANYKTAASQVKNGVDGVIVPQDNSKMADSITAFLLDKPKQQKIVKYLQSHHYGNEEEVKKLDSLTFAFKSPLYSL